MCKHCDNFLVFFFFFFLTNASTPFQETLITEKSGIFVSHFPWVQSHNWYTLNICDIHRITCYDRIGPDFVTLTLLLVGHSNSNPPHIIHNWSLVVMILQECFALSAFGIVERDETAVFCAHAFDRVYIQTNLASLKWNISNPRMVSRTIFLWRILAGVNAMRKYLNDKHRCSLDVG